MYNTTRRIGLARLLGGQGAQAGEGGWLDTSFMDTAYNQFAGVINHYYNVNAYNINDFPVPGNSRNQILRMGLQTDGNIVIGGSFSRVGGGFARDNVRTRMNVARIIGPATPGPEEGGIGNSPGNIGLTQSPYSVGDTGYYLYVTLNRTNGSLGPVMVALSTNLLTASSTPPPPPISDSWDPTLERLCLYPTRSGIRGGHRIVFGPASYGWRRSDGIYGLNNDSMPVLWGGESSLFLYINNDPSAAPILYANLNLLNLNNSNIISNASCSVLAVQPVQFRIADFSGVMAASHSC